MSGQIVGSFNAIRYEKPDKSIRRIILNRPDARNAQTIAMLYEVDAAFKLACHDDDVRVIILSGAGPHFSSGHDLSGREALFPTKEQSLGLWGEYQAEGWEGFYSREKELYLELTERWRNAPKPTIAQVHGACIMGGLMLAWACDLIVASDDARFRDHGADMGVPGVEFYTHRWEIGSRRAKEWLFTSDWITAENAARYGMVNHVVPYEDLDEFTIQLARKIAEKDRFTLKLIKESINAADDAAGRRTAMAVAFANHQIAHMQNMLLHGTMLDVSKLPDKLKHAIENILSNKLKG